MKNSVLDFKDYRQYLNAALATKGGQRGARLELAQTLGVQKGFISLVFHSKAHLSIEHAFKVSRFLQHSDDEREYFLLLVQANKSGSKELEKYFLDKLNSILSKRREIRERVQPKDELTENDQALYYSKWLYIAVHMCLMVPTLRSASAIAKYLGAAQAQVREILDFFTKTGLAAQANGEFRSGPTRIHLSSQSPLISKHHTHWRVQALRALDTYRPENLHYSSVMSISPEAAEFIREALLKTIESIEPTIANAKDVGVYTLAMDLFENRAI